MRAILSRSVARETLTSATVALYGTIAVALSLLGVFGLLSFTVAEHRRELGVRMALGAQRSRIVSLVVRKGMAPALAGMLIGLAISFGVGRWLSSLLHGVKAWDLWSHAVVLLLLVTTALLACAIPAWTASRIETSTVLRDE